MFSFLEFLQSFKSEGQQFKLYEGFINQSLYDSSS